MKSIETKKKRILIGAAVVLCIAGLVGICGIRNQKEETATTEQAEMLQETGIRETGRDETAETEPEEATAEFAVMLTEEEAKLLSDLYGAMKAKAYVDAAQILNDHVSLFETLTEETMEGEKYCYFEDETEEGQQIQKLEKLAVTGDSHGLVLTRYNTAFYGDYSDGKPEGDGNVIQAMILDEPRYTFAEGHWSDGKMNGEGKTGYHYYLNAPESGFIYTEKSGNYLDNQLDGVFTYRTENGAGETLTWEIRAVNGSTVITEDWTYYPYRREYMLASKESEERAYVLTEERASAVIWNNLITWDE